MVGMEQPPEKTGLRLCNQGGVRIVEDMIARILEMDKKARDMTDEAQKDKLANEQQVIQKKESLKNEYLERAKKRIAINQQSARKKADNYLRVIEERDSAVIQELDKTYEKNRDIWVDSIVARVTDG